MCYTSLIDYYYYYYYYHYASYKDNSNYYYYDYYYYYYYYYYYVLTASSMRTSFKPKMSKKMCAFQSIFSMTAMQGFKELNVHMSSTMSNADKDPCQPCNKAG